MEELTKRNGKGVWMREMDKSLKMFDASIEWLSQRIAVREEEIEKIRHNNEIETHEKNQILKSLKMKSIAEVLEEVRVLIDTHFFDGCRGQNRPFV